MYDLNFIRTGNMPADRSTDLVFDEEIEPSKTQQQFTAECDVNRIVRSNLFQPADVSQLRFEDVSEVVDYAEAMQIVMKAEESFSALDAEIRARFGNDPLNFVNFLSDPQNAQEAVKMGLAIAKPEGSIEPEKLIPTPQHEARSEIYPQPPADKELGGVVGKS